jgi:hypothetical protein
MFGVKIANYTSPAVAGNVFMWRNDSSTTPVLHIKNLSTDTSISCKIRESNDGSIWTDVAGTNVVIDPLAVAVFTPSTALRWLAFYSSGEAPITAMLTGSVSGEESTNLGDSF